jgi:hypothetical protein
MDTYSYIVIFIIFVTYVNAFNYLTYQTIKSQLFHLLYCLPDVLHLRKKKGDNVKSSIRTFDQYLPFYIYTTCD